MNKNAKLALAGLVGLLIGARYNREIDNFGESNIGLDIVPNQTPLSNLTWNSAKSSSNNSDQLVTLLLIAGLGYIAIKELS